MEETDVIKLSELDGEKLLKKLNRIDIKNLKQLREYLAELYHSGIQESPFSDEQYDILVSVIKNKDPKYKLQVGSKLREGENRVILPYWLGSADKITPEEPEVLERWLKRNNVNSVNNYTITDKLDGISCLLVMNNTDIKLYTRGDGKIGADISYLHSTIKNIPEYTENLSVRGELIMKKQTFEKKYRNKEVNGRTYKNARNMVAGLIGAKTARKGLSDIHFVSYEIVQNKSDIPISKQLEKLNSLGFEVVQFDIHNKKDITVSKLTEIYNERKINSKYEMDGIIIQSDVPYIRNISGNPSYMFAYKVLSQDTIKETTIIDIEWTISKWGQLKPVAVLEPIELNDITITRATAHNAKYVEENNLGPGAIIQVVRSKDVIPYILKVIKPAKKPSFPKTDFTWDSTHVNIIVKNTNIGIEKDICIKLISNFFSQLGIKFVSEATVTKLYDNGLNNLLKILNADKNRLSKIQEFKEKSVERIYTNIRKGLSNTSISAVLGASGVLGQGIGEKKTSALLKNIPNLLEIYKKKTNSELVELITSVEGFSNITAEKVVENLKYADELIKKLPSYVTYKSEEKKSNDLEDKKYVFSGFRSKELEQLIVERGGKVTTSVSKNTTAVIISSESDNDSEKVKKAKNLNIPVILRDVFEKMLDNKIKTNKIKTNKIKTNKTNKKTWKIFENFWSEKDVKNNPNSIFIYGDNDIKVGKGGQAIIRDMKNAFGIPTKKEPNNNPSSFYTDNEYEDNKKKIDKAIQIIKKEIVNYDNVYYPKDGLGTGLAQLNIKAPKTFKYLEKAIQKLKEYVESF